MRRAGRSLACAAFLVASFAVMPPASAQELSEKATRAFMDYAWSLTPEAFTKPSGETIQIDKTKKDQVMIPLDVAREVIRAGRLSAHAQVCELTQEQADNHNSLMRRETLSKKWTPQQLVYINQLHLTVVMLLTGRVKVVEKADDKPGMPPSDKGGDKEVVIEEGTKQAQTCSAEQKQKVKDLITAYVKTGPAAPTPTAAAAPAATDPPAASPSPPASPAPAAAAPAEKAPPPAAQK